ncbi:hypothetical protein PSAC2689_100318 [Paraburkholderia sacchari]
MAASPARRTAKGRGVDYCDSPSNVPSAAVNDRDVARQRHGHQPDDRHRMDPPMAEVARALDDEARADLLCQPLVVRLGGQGAQAQLRADLDRLDAVTKAIHAAPNKCAGGRSGHCCGAKMFRTTLSSLSPRAPTDMAHLLLDSHHARQRCRVQELKDVCVT